MSNDIFQEQGPITPDDAIVIIPVISHRFRVAGKAEAL